MKEEYDIQKSLAVVTAIHRAKRFNDGYMLTRKEAYQLSCHIELLQSSVTELTKELNEKTRLINQVSETMK